MTTYEIICASQADTYTRAHKFYFTLFKKKNYFRIGLTNILIFLQEDTNSNSLFKT